MINKVILVGRVGQKETTTVKNGSLRCRTSIATHKNKIDDDGSKRQITTWHKVDFFNKHAEICDKYLLVGSIVGIEGEIFIGEYEKDGVKRKSYSITATNYPVFFPNGRKGEPANAEIKHEENHEAPELWGKEHEKSIDWMDSDVPF